MELLLNQILGLLTSETGSLAYHLILAALFAGALLVSASQSAGVHLSAGSAVRRTSFGLGALLFMQFGLFLVSGMSWQGVPNLAAWLPVLDRAVILLSLLIFIWLWAFTQSSPAADSATLLMILMIVTASVLGGLWWLDQANLLPFNQSPLDMAAQITALVLIGLGILILLARRPEGWVMGIFMLVILAPGPIIQLVMPAPDGDYAGAVRLSQLSSAYFLLMLPQRFAEWERLPQPEKKVAGVAQLERRFTEGHSRYLADPQVWQALQKLMLESEPDQVCQTIVSSIARLAQADVCLLAFPPDEKGAITVRCGFDQSRGRYLEAKEVDANSMPAFTSALRMGRIRRLSMLSNSMDLSGIARLFNLERTGNVLVLPVLSFDGKPVSSVVLLSPYADKDWSTEEQSFLSTLSRLMVYFLQRIDENVGLRTEFAQARQATRSAQDQTQQALEDRRKLQDQLVVLREENQQSQLQLEGMAKLLSDQMESQQANEQLQTLFEKLKQENNELQADNERLLSATRLAVTESSLQKDQSMEAELRLALEEVAFLQALLAEADKRVTALKVQRIESSPLKKQFDEMAAISQELRQPLSSITGYVDFLLSESIGILGAAQRKYMERIRISTERMGRLIDDLIQVTASDLGVEQVEMSEVDLGMILQSAVAESGQELRQKHITLRMDLGAEPIHVYTDPYALRKALTCLIHNATYVTPSGGGVTLLARKQNTEGQEDYVLVQVSDSGGGIAAQDLPRVFVPRKDQEELGGVSSNNLDLANIKSTVEMMGGRTWVDSELGQGATFSVLLPTASSDYSRDEF